MFSNLGTPRSLLSSYNANSGNSSSCKAAEQGELVKSEKDTLLLSTLRTVGTKSKADNFNASLADITNSAFFLAFWKCVLRDVPWSLMPQLFSIVRHTENHMEHRIFRRPQSQIHLLINDKFPQSRKSNHLR